MAEERLEFIISALNRTQQTLQQVQGDLRQLGTGAQAANEKAGKSAKQAAEEMARMREQARRTAEQMRDLGQRLSVGVTLPLAALGVGALTAATRMDSLKRGLTAVAGSAQETERQLVRLREVAKLPGLGFEEAVRGSVNLQAAGFSAQLAERSLKAFGNALATVGKGRADLDGVITALSQIQSKGKVSAEEINQLAERVPQIRKVMQAAFGTADTEALQKSGMGTEEFIGRLVAALEKLPKATGGAANSFENARDSISQSLARIGESVLPIVARITEGLVPAIEAASKLFSGMPKTLQVASFAFGTVAAATGPVLIALASLRTAWLSLTGAIAGNTTALAANAAAGGAAAAAGGGAVAGRAAGAAGGALAGFGAFGAGLGIGAGTLAAGYTIGSLFNEATIGADEATAARTGQETIDNPALQARKGLLRRIRTLRAMGAPRSVITNLERQLNQMSSPPRVAPTPLADFDPSGRLGVLEARAGVQIAQAPDGTQDRRAAALMIPILREKQRSLAQQAGALSGKVGRDEKVTREFYQLQKESWETEARIADLRSRAQGEIAEQRKKALDAQKRQAEAAKRQQDQAAQRAREAMQVRMAALGVDEQRARLGAGDSPEAQAAAVVPALTAKQRELVAQARALSPATQEYWSLVREYWSIEGDKRQLTERAQKAELDAAEKARTSARKTAEEARSVMDARLDLVREQLKTLGMVDPGAAERMRPRLLLPALQEKLRGLQQPAPDETPEEAVRRQIEAEGVKRSILETVGGGAGVGRFGRTADGGLIPLFNPARAAGALHHLNAGTGGARTLNLQFVFPQGLTPEQMRALVLQTFEREVRSQLTVPLGV